MQRRAQAVRLRQQSANELRNLRIQAQTPNSDELGIPNFAAAFTKSLAHDENAEVSPQAYNAYLSALKEGTQESINSIPMGGTARLANPLACFGFEMEGLDSHDFACPAASPSLRIEPGISVTHAIWSNGCTMTSRTNWD